MRLVLLATGSHGDIRPLAALGMGLRRAGHTVVLATTIDHGPFVRSCGLSWGRIELDYRATLQQGLGAAIAGAGANLPGALWRIDRLIRPLVAEVQRGLWAAAQGADAIISGLPIMGQDIAEALGVPFIAARLNPSRCGDLPSAFWPWGALPGRWANRRSYDLVDQIAWQPLRPSVNRWRRASLGLPPAPFWGPFQQVRQRRDLVLHAYSPATLARPPEWGAHELVTGFWPLLSPGWQPPPQLSTFLASGPPPVYVGFGSLVSDAAAAEQLGRLVLAVLRHSGQRGLLATGWGGLGMAAPGPDMLVIDAAPHDWLFPRMAAVVHHGGAGTVAAAMRAGVPQISVPAWGDQIFWARRAAALGVSPAPLPLTRLRPAPLAAALGQAAADPQLRRRAAALGTLIAGEDGVGQAVAAIERRLGG
jgi:sterol 3beta-glucosyltransferase